ncbi:glutamic acid-rich protein [Dendrobium catenatum]|uniref:glutamic acid-rich protein n=1 Tax=Dendrobium catenatum TaxID=906689 RepID=UPI00109FD5E3|nr:glutamic acid-rich protein [Dendrobium catenatum]
MEEEEQSWESKEGILKNVTDPPDGAVTKVCTEIKNGNGNMREEVKNYENEHDSSEEFKEVVNLKERKDGEERNSVKQIENREEGKNIEETEVVIEKEPRKAVDGKEKEAVDSHDMEGKKNLEKNKDEEKKKEVEVQNVNEVEIGLEGMDGEVSSVLERVELAGDKKSVEAVEGVECSNDKNGIGEDEAVGKKSEEEGSNPISDKSVEELENDNVEEGVEEMKDVEHGETRSGDKDEESVLVQVEASDGGKARKEAKDMEICGAEEVVEKEAADVRDEGKLVVREGEEVKKDNGGNADKTVGYNQNEESLKRKRGRAQGPSEAGEAKKNGGTKENVEEMEVEGSRKNSMDVLSSPVVSSSDRPVRERKTVERWVEVIQKAPDRTVIIEKGRGTPLEEIPNVANNLARKKPAELKFLHQTLFGRKGKAVDFKSNLLQFSGFTWHESEEKQRAKTKEKLDKCVKETLLEMCDLFDLTVSKTNTKKDEIIVQLLDFMEAPHAMGEKQSSKSRKRERAPEADASKGSGGNFEKKSRQKHDKTEGTPNSDVKNEDEDSEEQSQKEDVARSHSKSDAEEKELEETGDEEEDESEVDAKVRKRKKVKKSLKGKENKDVKKSPRIQASSDTMKRKNGINSIKNTPKADGKSSLKTPPSKHSKAEKSSGEKALSRTKKDAESPKKSNSKSNLKEKSSGKASKSKKKSRKVQKSGPSKAELLKSISEILKKVDFNTATFTDILELLASEYKIDLTPRKAAIKLMIQDELTKMVDEEEENQDEEEMQ